MANEHWWIALVTFERCLVEQDVLPEWAHGASGWMLAIAPDREAARKRLVRDVEQLGFLIVQIDEDRVVFNDEEIANVDEYLARNAREIKSGSQTVWGTIHCYTGEGKA